MSLSLNGSDLQLRSFVFPMEDITQVGEARRFAATISSELKFSETRMARVGIIVNELGNNLISYAPGGELLIRIVPSLESHLPADGVGLEILSIDRGKGIENTAQSLQDGYSTSSTPGTGLGSVRRQADVFDLFSIHNQGTAIVTQIYKTDEIANTVTNEEFSNGVINVPIHGEQVCGDGYIIISDSDELGILVVDGLGHGPLAHEAALEAVDMFFLNHNEPTENLVQLIHGRLRSTRGAAIFVVKTEGESIISSGIGNVRTVIQDPTRQRTLISQNGTAGLQIRSARATTAIWDRRSALIFASDGISTKWDLAAYPGLQYRHPALIASILYRDFSRGRDDSTVVVIGPSVR